MYDEQRTSKVCSSVVTKKKKKKIRIDLIRFDFFFFFVRWRRRTILDGIGFTPKKRIEKTETVLRRNHEGHSDQRFPAEPVGIGGREEFQRSRGAGGAGRATGIGRAGILQGRDGFPHRRHRIHGKDDCREAEQSLSAHQTHLFAHQEQEGQGRRRTYRRHIRRQGKHTEL